MNHPVTWFSQEQIDLLVNAKMVEKIDPSGYGLTEQGAFFFSAWLRVIVNPDPQPLTPFNQIIEPPNDESETP